MASAARCERRTGAPGRFRVVTLRAGNRGVRAGQRVARLRVIEDILRDTVEVLGRVASAARRAEPGFVRIAMTGGALLVRQGPVQRDPPARRIAGEIEMRRLVTGGAHQRRVPAEKREGRLRVIETGRGLPGVRSVALRAVAPKRAAVGILVAGPAL